MTAEDARILVLGVGWGPRHRGGLERYTAALVDGLGHRAHAVVLGPVASPPANVTVVADHDAPLTTRLRTYARAVSARVGDADVVDASFALYAWLPVVGRRLRGRPLVVHYLGPWADESSAAGRRQHALRRGIERAVVRRAAVVVTLSGAFARLVVEHHRVPPWRVRILRPGVDLDTFAPGPRAPARVRLGIEPDAFVVATTRRLVPRTGVDVLLDAWAHAFGPDADARCQVLLVAGDGPERGALESRVAGRTDVRFLGDVPDDDLVALTRAVDVTVVPSRALEGFGLVALEALACGTPVIVTDTGGLPEAVAGLDVPVVPAGDAVALAAVLGRCLTGDLTLPDADACRAFASRHRWDQVVDRHRELYRRVRDATPTHERRVAYLDHRAVLSGGELALTRLLPSLAGVRAHAILFEPGPLEWRLGAAGVTNEVVAAPAGTRTLRRATVASGVPWGAVLATVPFGVRLARRLRRLRPDLVHANSLVAGIVGAPAARLARVPFVWHVRDRLTPDAMPGRAAAAVRRLAARLPDAVIANSAATLATLGPPRRAQVRAVIPDPYQRATPVRSEPPGGEGLCVGMVGRLAPWKGQDVFLTAFAHADLGPAARAVVVGAALFGEDEYAASLVAQADRLGIGERVDFRGFREDVEAELDRLDVLVHASVEPEPFGQVVVEGLAAGLPVVASRAGGPAEILTDGVDGLLVAPGDADALAAALTRLGADPARRDRLGAAARRRAQQYTPELLAPRVLDVYRQVLERRSR